MAKKTLDTDLSDFDDGLDLDFNDDISGSIDQSSQKNKRSPATSVIIGAVKGVKDTATSPRFIQDTLKKSLPKTYGEISDGLGEVSQGAYELYNQAGRTLKPQLARIAHRIDRIIPEDRKKTRGISEKILRMLGERRESENTVASQEEQTITATLAGVFGEQLANDRKENFKQDLRDEIGRKRHIQSTTQWANMDRNLSIQTQYLTTVGQRYQRKMLEIQLRTYMGQSEFHATAKRYFEAYKVQNEAIIKNTGLPEFTKITNSERFMDVTKTRFMNSLWGEGSVIKRGMDRLKRTGSEMIQGASRFLENAEQNIESGLSAREQMEQMNQTLIDMGQPPLSKAEMLGGAVAGWGVESVRDKLAPLLKERAEKNPQLKETLAKYARMAINPAGAIDQLRRKDSWKDAVNDFSGEGGAKNKLIKGLDFILSHFEDSRESRSFGTSVGMEDLNNPTMGFDQRAHISLVDVIPGHLSAIHREIAMLRTGSSDMPLQVYDFDRKQFVSRTVLKEKIKKQLTDEAANSYYQRSLGSTADSINRDRLQGEDALELKLFLGRLAKIDNIDLTPDNIRETRAYDLLSPAVKDIVDDYLADMDEGTDKESKRYKLAKDIQQLRSSAPTLNESMNRYTRAGYGDILEELGLGKTRSGGGFDVDERAFDEFMESNDIIRSDINVKQAIQKMKPAELLKEVRDRFKNRRLHGQAAKGPTSSRKRWNPKAAYDGFKNTQLYNWFYKPGEGDDQPHSGPMAQEVRQHFGEETAPGGKSIDLQSMNGATMAAIKHLGTQVETLGKRSRSVKDTDHLAAIRKDTAQIAKILQKAGPGRMGGGSGSAEPSDYKGLLGRMVTDVVNLGQKVGTDVFSAASRVFTVGKEKVVQPIHKFVVDTFNKNKEKGKELFSQLFEKASGMAGSVLEFGKDLLSNKLPTGLKQIGQGATWLKNKVLSQLNEARDLYLPGGTEPIIRAIKLRTGFYRDAVTGEALKTMDQLLACKNDIVDEAGNIILSLEEKAEGLYDRYGEQIKSTASQLFQGAVGAAIALKDRVSSGLSFLKEHGKEAFEKLKKMGKGKFGGMKDWEFKLGSQYAKDSYLALVDIRDILLGDVKAVRKRLRKEKRGETRYLDKPTAASTGGTASLEASAPGFSPVNLQGAFQKAKQWMGSMKDRVLGESEEATGPSYRPTDRQGPYNYRRRNPGAGSSRWQRWGGKAKSLFGRLTGGRGRMLGAGLSRLQGWGQGILSSASGMMGGAANLLSGLGNGRRLEDPDYDRQLREGEEGLIQSHAKGVVAANDRAWNDTDGSGGRDGGIEEREARIQALKSSRTKKGAEADLRLRYKSEENVLDTIAQKAGGLFDMLKSGMGGMFDMAGSVLGKVPGLGKILAGGKSVLGGLAGKAGDMASSAKDMLLSRGAKAAAVEGGKTVGRTLLKAGIRTYGFLALKALPAAGLALGNLAGTALTSIATVLASPLIIKAALVAAAAYGVWRLYKYAVRNNANTYERLRLLQYGLDESSAAKSNRHYVYTLEAYLQDGRITYTNGVPTLNTRKIQASDLLELFKIDKEDTKKAEAFNIWFHQRFTPVFLKHLEANYAVNPKGKLNTIDNLKPELLLKYLDVARFPSGPYNVVASPFGDMDAVSSDTESIQTTAENLMAKLKQDAKVSDKASVKPVSKIEPKKPEAVVSKAPAQPSESKPSLPPKPATSSKAEEVLKSTLGEDGKEPTSATLSQAVLPKTTALPSANGNIFSGASGMQFLKLQPGVNMEQLHPKVREYFLGMAEEYGRLTGKTIQVNEACRSRQEQEALFRRMPDKAARPGRSLHEFGLAIDINSADAAELERLGLMRKYGFTRPVGKETWHLEPAGIQRDLEAAKKDPALRDQMVTSSLYRGGGGVATLANFKGIGRNRDYALAIMNAADKTPQKPGEVEALLADVKAGRGNAPTPAKPPMAANTSGPQWIPSLTPENASAAQQVPSPGELIQKFQQSGEEIKEQYPDQAAGAGDQDIKKIIKDAARKTGVDPNILLAFAAMESDLNPNARAPKGSAGGLLGFIDTTWQEQLAKHGSKHGLKRNASKFDTEAASVLGGEYLKNNLRLIEAVKPNPGVVDAYLTHFLGAGGARTFLRAPPEVIGADLLPEAARSNPNLFYGMGGRPLTVKEIYDTLAKKLQKKAAQYGISISSSGTGFKPTSEQGLKGDFPAGTSLTPPANTNTKQDIQWKDAPAIGDTSVASTSTPASSSTQAQGSGMIPSKSGGIFVDARGNSHLAREHRESGQALAGPDLGRVESALEKSVTIQTESLDVLKSILSEVKAEKVAEVLAQAIATVVSSQKTNPLKEADQRNLGRKTDTGRSSLDLTRRAS